MILYHYVYFIDGTMPVVFMKKVGINIKGVNKKVFPSDIIAITSNQPAKGR
jgi:hypothetical protein